MNTAIFNRPLVVLVIIFALVLGLLATAEASTPLTAKEESRIVDLLARDISFTTKTLSREIRVYSWFADKYFSNSIHHFKSNYTTQGMSGTKLFWIAQKNQQGNIGPGLYAANDPTTSESYGNGYLLDEKGNYVKKANGAYERTFDYAALIEIVVPAGTVFHDVRGGINENRMSISKETLRALAPHCKAHLQGEIEAPSAMFKVYDGKKLELRPIDKQRLTSDKVCHRFFAKAWDKLNIRLIAYGWGNRVNEIHGTCEAGKLPAFVLTGKVYGKDTQGNKVAADFDTIDFSDPNNFIVDADGMELTVFARKLGKNPSPEKLTDYRLIHDYAMFTRVGPGAKLIGKPPLATWREFDDEDYDVQGMESLVKQTRFACDTKTYPEDVIPYFENTLNRE